MGATHPSHLGVASLGGLGRASAVDERTAQRIALLKGWDLGWVGALRAVCDS